MNYEQLEARERAQQKLDEVNDLLARLRHERAQQPEPAPEWTPPAPEAPKPVQRTVAPRERSAAPAARDWPAEEKWIRHIAGKMLEDFAKGFGGDIGELMAEARRDERALMRGEIAAAMGELRAEIAAERAARAAEAKYAELVARLDAAEQRGAVKPKPKLVDDNAA